MSVKVYEIIFFLALITGICIPVVYCAMDRLEVETLWNECDQAVLGTVISIDKSGKGSYYRIVAIEVETFYLKESDDPTVKVRIESSGTEDQPEFIVGERVFVFLRIPEEITYDYDYEVFGMYQGKWTVENNTAIRGDQSFTLPEKASAGLERELINGYQTLLAGVIGVIILISLILYKLIIK